jgi:hypothetical protein
MTREHPDINKKGFEDAGCDDVYLRTGSIDELL